MRIGWAIWAAACVLFAGAALAENLVPNGAFDDAGDPLRGWHADYAWTRNVHYEGNLERISVVPSEAGRTHVLRIAGHGQVGSKVESAIIPFEEGMRLRASLAVKGGPYRIYFSGHQWKPGIRPHGEPTLPELRPVYRSLAATGEAASWQTATLEIPGAAPSEMSLRHLRRVRFVTLYIWFLQTGYVDDVRVERMD